MISHGLGEILFFTVLILVVGATIFKIVKYRGLAPAGFGARIERTLGECDLGRGHRVKVHKLGGNTPDKAIGLEFVKYHSPVLVVTLSDSEAQKFAALIRSVAVGKTA
jgi:hypothetical protein